MDMQAGGEQRLMWGDLLKDVRKFENDGEMGMFGVCLGVGGPF